MEIEVLYRPSYALGVIKLKAGEAITAKSGAMVSMSDGIQCRRARAAASSAA